MNLTRFGIHRPWRISTVRRHVQRDAIRLASTYPPRGYRESRTTNEVFLAPVCGGSKKALHFGMYSIAPWPTLRPETASWGTRKPEVVDTKQLSRVLSPLSESGCAKRL